MENEFDYYLIAYYYSTNKLGYNTPIINGRRFKVWCIKNSTLITDIEFVLEEQQELKPGEFRKIRVRVVNDSYFGELLESGYRVFFGQVGDIRLGELTRLR